MLIIVNGYVCNNCTDVQYAKKGTDPAHPKKNDPLDPANAGKSQNSSAVILSGAVAKAESTNQNPTGASSYSGTTGAALNISA